MMNSFVSMVNSFVSMVALHIMLASGQTVLGNRVDSDPAHQLWSWSSPFSLTDQSTIRSFRRRQTETVSTAVPYQVPSTAPFHKLVTSDKPSEAPSQVPSDVPSDRQSDVPSDHPSDAPSAIPSVSSSVLTNNPSASSHGISSIAPSQTPSWKLAAGSTTPRTTLPSVQMLTSLPTPATQSPSHRTTPIASTSYAPSAYHTIEYVFNAAPHSPVKSGKTQSPQNQPHSSFYPSFLPTETRDTSHPLATNITERNSTKTDGNSGNTSWADSNNTFNSTIFLTAGTDTSRSSSSDGDSNPSYNTDLHPVDLPPPKSQLTTRGLIGIVVGSVVFVAMLVFLLVHFLGILDLVQTHLDDDDEEEEEDMGAPTLIRRY